MSKICLRLRLGGADGLGAALDAGLEQAGNGALCPGVGVLVVDLGGEDLVLAVLAPGLGDAFDFDGSGGRVQSELSAGDIGVRYHGDEFAAILVDTDRSRAVERADSIRSSFGAIDLSGIIGDADFRILASIGISIYPEDAATSAELVASAHRKMYAARDAGGDRVMVKE